MWSCELYSSGWGWRTATGSCKQGNNPKKVHQSGMNPMNSTVHKKHQQGAEAFNSGEYILNCNTSTTENEYVKLLASTVWTKQWI